MKIGYRPPKSPVFRGMLRKSGVSPGFGRFYGLYVAVWRCMGYWHQKRGDTTNHDVLPRFEPALRLATVLALYI